MSSGALTHPGELELIFDVIRRCELEKLRGVRLVTPESAGIYAHLLIGRNDTAGAVFLTDEQRAAGHAVISRGGGCRPILFEDFLTKQCRSRDVSKLILCTGHEILSPELFSYNDLYTALFAKGILICDLFEVSDGICRSVLSPDFSDYPDRGQGHDLPSQS